MKIIDIKAALCAKGAFLTPPGELDIGALEKNIGISLPEDYREYLREMGTILLGGKETYGIVEPRDYYLNVDRAVQVLRQLPDYPVTMIPLASSGDGAWFLLDSENGCVFSWQAAGIAQDQKQTFPEFLMKFFDI